MELEVVLRRGNLGKETTQFKSIQISSSCKSDYNIHKGETSLFIATSIAYDRNNKIRKKKIHQQNKKPKKELKKEISKVMPRKEPRITFSPLGDLTCFNYRKL